MKTFKDTYKDTYNFEYWPDENNDESSVRLSYDVNGALTIEGFQEMCRSFAFALGFETKNIDKYFPTE
jgi:hypothetical protein